MRRRTFILGLALGALPLTACGGSKPDTGDEEGPTPVSAPSSAAPVPTDTPLPPTKTYGLNELVSVQNWDLAIQKVERRGKKLALSQFTNTAVAQGTWFIILVDMKNTGNRNLGVSAADFALKAGGGTFNMLDTPEAAGYGESRGGRRFGAQIPPGVSVTYFAVFDVPADATDMRLIFKHDTHPVFAVGNAAP